MTDITRLLFHITYRPESQTFRVLRLHTDYYEKYLDRIEKEPDGSFVATIEAVTVREALETFWKNYDSEVEE